jgi:probable addiction module antidote protein
MKTTTSPYDVAEHLRTPEEMAAYLEACIEEADGDVAFIAKALGDIARAQAMTKVAKDSGLSRESLYKALSGDRSPSFDTILKVVSALGLKLIASVRSEAEVAFALLARRRSASVACGEATPSNKPLEWTGRREVCFDIDSFMPATQGQRRLCRL